MTDEKLARRLRAAMDEEGAGAFARRLGVTPSYLHAMVNGIRPVSPRVGTALGYRLAARRWVKIS